jgi:hypothetical protein
MGTMAAALLCLGRLAPTPMTTVTAQHLEQQCCSVPTEMISLKQHNRGMLPAMSTAAATYQAPIHTCGLGT